MWIYKKLYEFDTHEQIINATMNYAMSLFNYP